MTERAPRPARKRHRAGLSRIAATGLAACATFGMVAGMALGPRPSSAEPVPAATVGVAAAAPSPPTSERPRIVIIQRRLVPADGATSGGSGSVGSSISGSTGQSSSAAAAPAPAPVAPAPAPMTQSSPS